MKTHVVILGGGISGLIAAHQCEKQGIDWLLLERNAEGAPPPKLHYLHADIGPSLDIATRPIEISTNIFWDGRLQCGPATIDQMNHFSLVTLGSRITPNSMKYITTGYTKGYLPVGGIDTLADAIRAHLPRARIVYDAVVTSVDMTDNTIRLTELDKRVFGFRHLISTIPLPSLLHVLHGAWTVSSCISAFASEPLKVTEITIPPGVAEGLYQVVYIPRAEYGYARLSILGNRIVAERANGAFEGACRANRAGLRRFLGALLPNLDIAAPGVQFLDTENRAGRFLPVAEETRRFVLKTLRGGNINCLGRYAEWTYRRTEHVVERAVELAEELRMEG